MSTFPVLWRELSGIGRDAGEQGCFRMTWGPAERACREWFRRHCRLRGLAVHTDGNGNDVAWWGDPAPGAVLTGSHLDSVPAGGTFDGPLGVVSALCAIDRLRDRGVRLRRPIGVAVFAEEEGARFGIACLGSRLASGQLDPSAVAGLRDAEGLGVADAMNAVGETPDFGISDLLLSASAFVELHIEQGRGLVEMDSAIGLCSGIWPHGRWRVVVTGEPNHAGTTRLADRRDPLLTAAEIMLAARKKAKEHNSLATFGRVQVSPGAANAVPGQVLAWLDARAPSEAILEALLADIGKHATARANRDGTALRIERESFSPAVQFSAELTARLSPRLGAPPTLPTGAGHDAGILAAAGIPASMLFVRNPTGVSHAAAESADGDDCEAGVDALATALEELACR